MRLISTIVLNLAAAGLVFAGPAQAATRSSTAMVPAMAAQAGTVAPIGRVLDDDDDGEGSGLLLALLAAAGVLIGVVVVSGGNNNLANDSPG